ncbi:MAG: carotenoid biosynthesis protein [Chitinophagales bacterium]|nr:carotenoid biosynthesis protein [Chitinophagales bacterium]
MNWFVDSWRPLSLVSKALLVGLCVVLLVGAIGMNLSFARSFFEPKASLTLFFASFILIYLHHPKNLRFGLAVAAIFFIGMLSEIVGVKTGRIFGVYTYTGRLGIELFSVPVVIGFNWFALTYGSNMLTSGLIQHRWFRVFASAFVMVLFDLLIEPFAIRHQYWIWHENGTPPLQNYMAWFVVSILNSAVFNWLVPARPNAQALVFMLGLLLFLVSDLLCNLLEH